MSVKEAKAFSFPNIALIKYWGKIDVEDNIPTNASISFSLPKLITKTRITKISTEFDIFHLDGSSFSINKKMQRVIDIFKTKCNDNSSLFIDSYNDFPHSCGLASSASGISALVKALNIYYETQMSIKEMSEIARIGSGSACRSIENGLVKWTDKFALKVDDWKELRIFVIVLDNVIKNVGSTEGMVRTVETSTLFKNRIARIDEKVKCVEDFVKSRNFADLGVLVMKDSNELHAVCMDSYPPILYLNDKSIKVTNEIMKLNQNGFKAFYSFDAGPNPFIFVLDENYEIVYNFFNDIGYKIIEAR